MRNFKLIVKETGNPTVSVLQYFNKNIQDINSMQVFLIIVKMKEEDLDKDIVGRLAAKGITRFPALISDNGRVFLGVQKIRDLFDKNLQGFRKQDIAAPPKREPTETNPGNPGNTEYGSNPELANYWQGLLNDKSQDDEDTINESRKDIERRMREYNPPKQRQKSNGTELEDDPRLSQARAGNKPKPAAASHPVDDDENIRIDPVNNTDIADMLSNVDHEDRNAEDDRMERAMWENKVSGAFNPD